MSRSTSRAPGLLRAGAPRSTFRATSCAYEKKNQKSDISRNTNASNNSGTQCSSTSVQAQRPIRIPNPESTFYQPSALPKLIEYTYGEICIDVPVVLLCASYVVDGFFDELTQRRVGCDFESIARRFEPFRYVGVPEKPGKQRTFTSMYTYIRDSPELMSM